MTGTSAAILALAALAAAALANGLIRLAWPLMRQYALARPSARSGHAVPTPQGGGAAVVIAALAVAALVVFTRDFSAASRAWFLAVAAAAGVMGCAGAVDDIRPLPVLPRLALQFGATAAAVFLAPAEWRLAGDFLPFWLERAACVLLGVWFINLTNFMDGLDWITIAEFIPVTAAVALLGAFGKVSPATQVLAAALLGALCGFAPFNKPAAKLFLGDVGSLPIGLLAAALLFDLACHGALAAAIILPLYYIADATLTLAKRLVRREKVWIAHRQHAYQRAVDSLWPGPSVTGAIFGLNAALAALAFIAATSSKPWAAPLALAMAIGLVGYVIFRFTRKVAA